MPPALPAGMHDSSPSDFRENAASFARGMYDSSPSDFGENAASFARGNV